jgi:solute carrier family 4 (sodium borate transporter), member 11
MSERIDDVLGVPKTVVAQCLGGIFFSIFAGQPLIVVMTTAPLTLYVKGSSTHEPMGDTLPLLSLTTVIYTLCAQYRLDFRDTYALVGLWNSFFLILYSFCGASKIMKWSTR